MYLVDFLALFEKAFEQGWLKTMVLISDADPQWLYADPDPPNLVSADPDPDPWQ